LVGCGQQQATPTSTPAETPETLEQPAIAEPIKVGIILPLTGDAGSYGTMIQNIISLWNKQNDDHFDIIWEDGKCNPKDGTAAAQKLINIDKVDIVYTGCSGTTLAVAPIAKKAEILQVSALSTSPAITEAEGFIFRTCPSDSGLGAKLAEEATKQGFEKVAILSEMTDYAIGVRDVFKENFSGEIIEENFISTEFDFKTRITKIIAAKPDAIFVNPQTMPKLNILMKQLQEQKWDKSIIFGEFMNDQDTLPNHYEYMATLPTVYGAVFSAPESPELEAFTAAYETEFGEKPAFPHYTATNLDLMDLLKKLTKETNSTDGAVLADAFINLEGYTGYFGPLTFDENGDPSISQRIFTFNGTEFVSAE